MKDAFDQFWEWSGKPIESDLTIDADLHHAITSLPYVDRFDRAKVNEAASMIKER